CRTFEHAPPLDGVLYTDLATRERDATDKGNIIRRTPCAVLRAGSVDDIQKMVRFCRRHHIKVAARGQGHTTHGQGLTCGLVIENSALNTIHSIGPDGADVDAGVLWKDLIIAAVSQGLTPPVITGYTQLSVGGTLSVGGISPGYGEGAQVDRVRELEVVTGEGRVVRCSERRHRKLFEAVLAGLGQCGVITRAVVDLVPAKQLARTYLLHYTDNAVFFSDLRKLINRGEIEHVFNIWFPQGTGFGYQINAITFYDPEDPPDDDFLLRGLSLPPAAAVKRDSTYLDYVLNVDVVIDFFIATMRWNELIKPWFDVWLPEEAVEQYVGEVIPTLTPLDMGPTGFILLFPERRSRYTRPMFRVPDAGDGDDDWVYLFDILTASAAPGPDPAYVEQMLARNRRLFERARALGGTRYPIGSVEFSRRDWVRQYGDFWPELVRRKRRFDPDNILTPGPGIF
ncbi:MAG: FAD-binding protein, partial [Pyrinomonadaceae bacterium]